MAETTVNLLTALGTAPATDDRIPIWDLDAAAYKYVTVANLLGGTMTGAGVIATGGFTLTVPATGSAALLGTANTFTAINTLASGAKSGETGTLADDTAMSFTPLFDGGLMIIYGLTGLSSAGVRNKQATISYRISSDTIAILSQPASEVEVTTGVLAGTTGTDTKLTVSVHSTDGKIYIENRHGSNINEGYFFLV